MKTNFHNKNFALSLAFIMRFKATRKWTISMRSLTVDGGGALGMRGTVSIRLLSSEMDWYGVPMGESDLQQMGYGY